MVYPVIIQFVGRELIEACYSKSGRHRQIFPSIRLIMSLAAKMSGLVQGDITFYPWVRNVETLRRRKTSFCFGDLIENENDWCKF